METNDKYEWFFSFKSIFQTEKYISIVTNKWHRVNIARFRLRTLGFYANKRWFDDNKNAHVPCPMCDSAPDDEKHFLFKCKSYDDIRKQDGRPF